MFTALNFPACGEFPGYALLPTKKSSNIWEFKISVSIPVSTKSMFVVKPSFTKNKYNAVILKLWLSSLCISRDITFIDISLKFKLLLVV